jgi:hypothetical protein
MKKIFKRWLTNGFSLRDYYAIANIGDNLHVNVVARLHSGVNLNVTDVQWTLAYNPIVIGILISRAEEKEFRTGIVHLMYYWTSKSMQERREKLAEIHVRYKETIDISSVTETLVLAEAVEAKNYQLSITRRLLILFWLYRLSRKREKYFGSLTLNLYKQYAVQFTYPRKVMLIAAEYQGTPHFFPIDLHACLAPSTFLLGLRHTNKVIPFLQKTRKVVICSVPANEYKTLYYLGKFSKDPADTSKSYNKSQILNFQIPEFVSGYYELELVDDRNIGSQQLFVGKILNEQNTPANTFFLYHVHILQVLAAHEKKQPYTLLN